MSGLPRVLLVLVLAFACVEVDVAGAAPQPPRPPHIEIAIDSAGRIVAALGGGSGNTAAIVRLGSRGELDPSFAGDGILGPFRSAKAAAIALLPNDSTLAATQVTGTVPKLRRFRADGSLDRSFGRGGVVRLPIVPTDRLLVQPDGHFLVLVKVTCVCGYTFSYLKIERYAANGRQVRAVTHYEELWHLDAADLDSRGGLLVAGGVSDLGYETYARFRPRGGFDPRFGGREGLKIYEEDEALPSTSALVAQPDGGLVLAGGEEAAELRRRTAQGSVDRGFGNDGVAVCAQSPPSQFARVPFNALAAAPGGAILAAGGQGGCGLVRYLPDGTQDPAFGADGRVDLEAQGMARPLAMAIGPGGEIAVAGWDPATLTVKIARLSATGQLEGGFGSGGVVSLNGY